MKNIIIYFLCFTVPCFLFADLLRPNDLEMIERLSLEEREKIYSFLSYIDDLPPDKKKEVQTQLKSSFRFAKPVHTAWILNVISTKPEDSLQVLKALSLTVNEDISNEELLDVLHKLGFSTNKKEDFLYIVNNTKKNQEMAHVVLLPLLLWEV